MAFSFGCQLQFLVTQEGPPLMQTTWPSLHVYQPFIPEISKSTEKQDTPTRISEKSTYETFQGGSANIEQQSEGEKH